MRVTSRCRASTVLLAATLCVLGCGGGTGGGNAAIAQAAEWTMQVPTPTPRPAGLTLGTPARQVCGDDGRHCGGGSDQVAHIADNGPEIVEVPATAAPIETGAPTERPVDLAAATATTGPCAPGSLANACANVGNGIAQPSAQPAPRPEAGAATGQSLRQQVGQMLVMGFQGQSPGDRGVQIIGDYLEKGLIGGVLIGRQNVRNRGQVAELTRYLRSRSGGVTPIIAVDQEGGFVQRLGKKAGFADVSSAARIADLGADEALRQYRVMAEELEEAGVNLNLGPVVDVNVNPRNPVIAKYKRSYSAKPATVIKYAEIFVRAHREQGIATSAKHFPGHGSSTRDTHVAFADVTNTFKDYELTPYDALGSQFSSVMSAHVAHERITGSRDTPASLSRTAIETYLRGQLNYDKVVITDDMEMAAVRKRPGGLTNAAVEAVAAGNDMLIFSNTWKHNPQRADVLIDTIVRAVKDGRISPRRIREANRRIAALRRQIR